MMRIFLHTAERMKKNKEIPMPLAKECEGMEVLISNYKDTSDMSVLRPYEARMYIR